MRTREWLRSFLDLGARKALDNVPLADVSRQEDTVLEALDILDAEPGVVLADEVGMGKTYEALGIIAAFRQQDPKSRIIVITPGPDLNTKWKSEFERFSDPKTTLFDFQKEVYAAEDLSDFVQNARDHRILLAPITLFQGARGGYDQSFLLSLYFWWREAQGARLHGHTVNAVLNRFREGRLSRVDVENELFLGHIPFDKVRPHLDEAFRKGRRADEHSGLDDLFGGEGYRAFENEDRVRRALDLARFRLVRALLPDFSLLVVDEAHKLKNAQSLRSQAVDTVFWRKYAKTLFLTATPFQLSVEELHQVFVTFSNARGAPADVMDRAQRFFTDIREYQEAYTRLQKSWSSLDAVSAREFEAYYSRSPELDAPIEDLALRTVAQHVRDVRNLKTSKIEPGFRRWMIRSLKQEKRVYRRHSRHALNASGEGALPFLIYERLIAELFRRHQGTHKAAVQINMVSSYGAARGGELLDSEVRDFPEEAESYRRLLRGILQDLDSGAARHPKVDFVLHDALAAAERGEKTLIFCARIATLTELARKLTALWEERMLDRWRRVYPGAERDDIFDTTHDDKRTRSRHSLLQSRFRRPQDMLSLALRERYLGSLLPIVPFVLEHLGEVSARANDKLRRLKVSRTSATDRDYRLLKRCVEQAAAELWRQQAAATPEEEEVVAALCDPRFLTYGLDHTPDELEGDDTGTHTPTWHITEQTARLVIPTRPTLWTHLAPLLSGLAIPTRVGIVERLASYLTFKDVPFLADVVYAAREQGLDPSDLESQLLLPVVDDFWISPLGAPWLGQLRAFLDYFSKRNGQQQQDILNGPLKTGQLVRETRDGESRERLREAFNTPLFPMVLVANEVMQEGLDLHKNCRRVVHHDLAWNPAQLEQRVGRVDRIGSLTLHLREKDPSAELHVVYPLIRNTIDERLFRTVKEREKWLEFLLGAPPNFSEYADVHEEVAELPAALAHSLAINLRPRSR